MRKAVKKSWTGALLALLLFLVLLPITVTPYYKPATGLRKTFEEFCYDPSAMTARAFMASIPVDGKGYVRHIQGAGDHLVIDGMDEGRIRREIRARNKDIIDSAFRLLCLNDQKNDAFLRDALGELIRIDPGLFLNSLLPYKSSPYFRRASYPVDGLLECYRSRSPRSQYELMMRIAALKGVECGDRELDSIRQECVALITRALRVEETGPPADDSLMKIEGEVLDWAETYKAFKEFLALPSPAKAAVLGRTIPVKNVDNIIHKRMMRDVAPLILGEGGIILEHEIVCGNGPAEQTALLLRCYFDGGLNGEILNSSIAALIRTDPFSYLETLYGFHNYMTIDKSILAEEALHLSFRAEAYDIQMKLAALERIKDPRLMGLRDECVFILANELASAKRAVIEQDKIWHKEK